MKKTQRQRTGPLVIDVYARISRSTSDNRGRSVGSQIEECLAELADRGAVAGTVFKDESKSAWNPTVVREDFNQLMQRLETGESDGVIVYDLTRFSRKVIEGERLVLLADKGLVVWSVYGDYDLATADGRRHFRDDMVAAAGESDKISERTRRGKRLKARRGKSNASHRGFAMPGYLPNAEGWETGDPRIAVPPEQLAAEREAVRELAKRLLAGESWAEMVRYLNGTGLTTTYGHDWSTTSMRTMLKRPSLAGIIVHDDVEVGLLSGEPVLDRETWERCQSVMASKGVGRKPSERYLLSGLITCGRCSHPLTGRPRTNSAPYPDGEVKREYWCQPQAGRGGGCGRLAIDQRYADEVVEQAVLERLGDPRHAERLARHAAKVQAERDEVLDEIARLERDAEALAGKVATWGFERVEAAMRPLDARLGQLRESLGTLDQPEAASVATRDVARDWRDGSVNDRRAMVRRAFPNGITILPTEARSRAARRRDRFQWSQ